MKVYEVRLEHFIRAVDERSAADHTVAELSSGRLPLEVREFDAPFGHVQTPTDRDGAYEDALSHALRLGPLGDWLEMEGLRMRGRGASDQEIVDQAARDWLIGVTDTSVREVLKRAVLRGLRDIEDASEESTG